MALLRVSVYDPTGRWRRLTLCIEVTFYSLRSGGWSRPHAGRPLQWLGSAPGFYLRIRPLLNWFRGMGLAVAYRAGRALARAAACAAGSCYGLERPILQRKELGLPRIRSPRQTRRRRA